MRLLVTSDWHADAVTAGVRRFADVERAVEEAVAAAERLGCGAFLFLGDLCDPDCGAAAFRCVRLALEAARRLAHAGIESHWIAGNHDVIEDGSGETVLGPLAALPVPTFVHERPRLVSMGDGGMWLLVLPYPPLTRTYDPACEVEVAVAAERAGDARVVVAGHLSLPGVVPGSEGGELARGREVPFPLEACARHLPSALLLNGHYHRRMVHEGVYVPGSLERLGFGEECNEPGWLVVTA